MHRLADHAKNKMKENLLENDENLEDIFDHFKKAVRDIFALKKYSLIKCLDLAKGLLDFTINFYKDN